MAALPTGRARPLIALPACVFSRWYQIIGELHPTATMKSCASSSLVPVAKRGQAPERRLSRDILCSGARCAICNHPSRASSRAQVRTGLHAGEIELKGSDIIATTIGTRVAIVADGRRILAPCAIWWQVRNRRRHRLNGMREDMQHYAGLGYG
jgi:hypothetical protein